MKRIDLVGRQFGELTVVKLSEPNENNHRSWICQCSCGNTTLVKGYSLLHGHYKSCGCKRVEKRDRGAKTHVSTDTIDGTRKTALKSKLHTGNKSGHKGVMWLKGRNKWRAYIGIKGKQISLGHYNHLDDAVQARIEAEEKYHKPYLEDDEK